VAAVIPRSATRCIVISCHGLCGHANADDALTALVLNLPPPDRVVRFARAGLFSWALFWPFALGSIPLAYLGGAITLPGHWYRTLVGLVLWLAAVRLWLDLKVSGTARPPGFAVAVLCGMGIGLLAGLSTAASSRSLLPS
jgi:uncharacterized membrane protein YfcA